MIVCSNVGEAAIFRTNGVQVVVIASPRDVVTPTDWPLKVAPDGCVIVHLSRPTIPKSMVLGHCTKMGFQHVCLPPMQRDGLETPNSVQTRLAPLKHRNPSASKSRAWTEHASLVNNDRIKTNLGFDTPLNAQKVITHPEVPVWEDAWASDVTLFSREFVP
eukprot:TRINITY_DN34874_c0_g1_i1.p1 TRINITY_DN34874_c0_g1~~TRINITY_DN34874_c0_g1_i1.p1  ORF type:complete len:161 (+),score=22.48 TRINITY_DN34874_c0_g1_i1:3-485(+)